MGGTGSSPAVGPVVDCGAVDGFSRRDRIDRWTRMLQICWEIRCANMEVNDVCDRSFRNDLD